MFNPDWVFVGCMAVVIVQHLALSMTVNRLLRKVLALEETVNTTLRGEDVPDR